MQGRFVYSTVIANVALLDYLENPTYKSPQSSIHTWLSSLTVNSTAE
jgi:hypothetical protein